MNLILYTGLEGAALKRFLKLFSVKSMEILPLSSLKRSVKAKSADGFIFIDSGDSESLACKRARELSAMDISFGVVDSAGVITDPAALFFSGALDYIGPALLKKGVDAKRLMMAVKMAGNADGESSTMHAFPGWQNLADGAEFRFVFCYASISDQAGLHAKIGEKRLAALKDSFSGYLSKVFSESSGLVWMKDQTGVLILFPESAPGKSPIRLAFETEFNRLLIGYEIFGIEVPLGFKFVFHAGSTEWRKPGMTGNIVSEDVNYIYHLAVKFAEDNRITVSDPCSPWLPEPIADFFTIGKNYEGKGTQYSSRFP